MTPHPDKRKGSVSLGVFGMAVTLIMTLTGVVYTTLKETDSRLETNVAQNTTDIKDTRELMIRIDQRLANIESAVGVKRIEQTQRSTTTTMQ